MFPGRFRKAHWAPVIGHLDSTTSRIGAYAGRWFACASAAQFAYDVYKTVDCTHRMQNSEGPVFWDVDGLDR